MDAKPLGHYRIGHSGDQRAKSYLNKNQQENKKICVTFWFIKGANLYRDLSVQRNWQKPSAQLAQSCSSQSLANLCSGFTSTKAYSMGMPIGHDLYTKKCLHLIISIQHQHIRIFKKSKRESKRQDDTWYGIHEHNKQEKYEKSFAAAKVGPRQKLRLNYLFKISHVTEEERGRLGKREREKEENRGNKRSAQ